MNGWPGLTNKELEMFGFLGDLFGGSVHTDCDNIDYVPTSDGMVYRDDPAGQFGGEVPISSLPGDIQDAVNDAIVLGVHTTET